MGKKQKKMLARILVSAVLFAAGFFLPLAGWSQLVFYLTVYAIIGWDIVWKAVRNIAHGQEMTRNVSARATQTLNIPIPSNGGSTASITAPITTAGV